MRALRSALAVVVAGILLAGCAPGAERGTSIDAQVDYLSAHWQERNEQVYGSLEGTDCVNFTSQGLVARGWEMDEDWWHLQVLGVNQYSKAWVSSTAFNDYLAAHPEKATVVDAADAVVGDIVQFDYDNSGNRDHTATISRIDADGTILLVQHSDDALDRSVADQLAEHDEGGGVAYYWHLLDLVG